MKTSIIVEGIDNILLITRRIKWITECNMPLLAGQCWKKFVAYWLIDLFHKTTSDKMADLDTSN